MFDMLENIIWLAIGFVPTYGAMELTWRLAKRSIKKKQSVNCNSRLY
jgi:hypothetical protein